MNVSAMRRHALGDAAVEFADARELAADPGDRVPGSEQHAADVGLAGNHLLPADDLGEDLLVSQAVLQRHHDAVGTDDRAGGSDRLAGVERLHQHDDEVGGPDVVGRRPGLCRNGPVGAVLAQAEAARVDRIDVRRRAVDEPHLVAGFGQHAAEGAPQRARAQETDLHGSILSPRGDPGPAQAVHFALRLRVDCRLVAESRADSDHGAQYRRVRRHRRAGGRSPGRGSDGPGGKRCAGSIGRRMPLPPPSLGSNRVSPCSPAAAAGRARCRAPA